MKLHQDERISSSTHVYPQVHGREVPLLCSQPPAPITFSLNLQVFIEMHPAPPRPAPHCIDDRTANFFADLQDPDVFDTYGDRASEFGSTAKDIVAHAEDIGMALRVVLATLSDGKLLDVPSIVQLSVNVAQHLKRGVNLPLGLEQNIEGAVHRMKELARTIYCGDEKTMNMMEYAWASLVSQSTTEEAADKSSEGIDKRRKVSKASKQGFFRRVLTLLRWLKANYKMQLAMDVDESLDIVLSTAAKYTADMKEQAVEDINGLLGLTGDVFTRQWNVWDDGPEISCAYKDAAGAVRHDYKELLQALPTSTQQAPYGTTPVKCERQAATLTTPAKFKMLTTVRILRAMKSVAQAEYSRAKAMPRGVHKTAESLLQTPSIAQLVKAGDDAGVSKGVGKVTKAIRVPKALHALQPVDEDAEDANEDEAAPVPDGNSGSASVEPDDVDIVYGCLYMKFVSALRRAVRRGAVKRLMEAKAAVTVSASGSAVGPMHEFVVQKDEVVPTEVRNGGELKCTLVFYANDTGQYCVGGLR